MMTEFSPILYKTIAALLDGRHSIIVNYGGTRSGKTYAILQLIYFLACSGNRGKIISIVSESFPHLKRGCMREFALIAESFEGKGLAGFNRSDNIYSFRSGSIVEFFSADNAGKVHGPQRDILFVNECNRLPYETVRQLMIRTSGVKLFDYNPVSSFWINDKILNRGDVAVIHSTYLDNRHLSAEQVAEIESNRADENWWRVYGLGLEGRLDGLVFPDFEQVDAPIGRLLGYGVDFGFTNDHTAVVALYVDGKSICLDEVVYATGLTTSDLSGLLKDAGLRLRHDVLVCDSARPDSIEELYRYGWNAKPCRKGKDSVIAGINAIKRHTLKLTKRSVNMIKELRNYTWECDKEGKPTNKPVDRFNHAIDAARYIVTDRLRPAAFATGTRLIGGFMEI